MSTRIQMFLKPHNYINFILITQINLTSIWNQWLCSPKTAPFGNAFQNPIHRNAGKTKSGFKNVQIPVEAGPYNHTVMCLTKKLTCTREFVADIVDQGKHKLHDIFWSHLTMIQLYTPAWSQYINKLISSIFALLRKKIHACMVSDLDRWFYTVHYFKRVLTLSELKNIKNLQCMSKGRKWIFSGFMHTW